MSTSMSISTSLASGTLTATGTKKQPHVLPAKTALASSAPLPFCFTVNSGDLPMGSQPTYCSPAAP